MGTDLTRIREKARKEPDLVFTSLYHHITDVDNLRACYDTLPANKASGVDGVTKNEYGRQLEKNLRDLPERLRRMGLLLRAEMSKLYPEAGEREGETARNQQSGRQDCCGRPIHGLAISRPSPGSAGPRRESAST